MASEVFNGKRFLTYFKYDLSQTLRIHVKAAVLIGFAGVIFYLLGVAFNAIFDGTWQAPGFRGRVLIFILASTALELYQVRTYGYLTDRRKGSSWLLVPASAFEKWLSMILMTLVVIPVAYIITYGGTDAILSLADPTYGKMLLGSAIDAFNQFQTSIAAANDEYATTWNLSFMIVPYLVGFCCNFLYFLLCGVTFKRHKLLYAFLVLFGISITTSMCTAWFGLESNIELEEFADAEVFIRHMIGVVTYVVGAIAICLAGGIFYRIKTLKH